MAPLTDFYFGRENALSGYVTFLETEKHDS